MSDSSLHSMSRLLAVFGVGLITGLALVLAHAQQTKRSISTPQEAFSAARTALNKDDLVGLCECLTDDARDLLGGGLAVNVMLARKILSAGGSADDQKQMKRLDELLAKHGLVEKNLRPSEPLALAFTTADLQGRLKIARAVLAPVKDRNAFVADLMTALQKKSHGAGGVAKGDSELTDVAITGDTATGIVIKKIDGKETRSPMLFQKVRESWKIDLTAELNKTFSPKK